MSQKTIGSIFAYSTLCVIIFFLLQGSALLSSFFVSADLLEDNHQNTIEVENISVLEESGDTFDSIENSNESTTEEIIQDESVLTVSDEPETEAISFVDTPIGEEIEEIEQLEQKETASMALPEAKKPTSGELRVGFVTDTHVTSSGRALDSIFIDRLNVFVERMNNVFGPDFLLANGDIIEGTGRPAELGKIETSLVQKIFQRTTIPAYWVLGNHDLRSVSKKEWKDTLGIDYTYTAFNQKEYRIFILDSNFTSSGSQVKPGNSYTRGNVSEEQIAWLKKELKKTNKIPIIFMHHPPLHDVDLRSNSGLLKNAEELQALFAQYDVLSVFAGHIEDLYVEERDGVHYYVIPGLVKHPTYQGAFAEIIFKKRSVHVEVSYLKKDGSYKTVTLK